MKNTMGFEHTAPLNNADERKNGITSNPTPLRTLYVVGGLLSFAFILVAGVAISQRQQLLRGSVSPTVPDSQPAAAEDTLTSCDLIFAVE